MVRCIKVWVCSIQSPNTSYTVSLCIKGGMSGIFPCINRADLYRANMHGNLYDVVQSELEPSRHLTSVTLRDWGGGVLKFENL